MNKAIRITIFTVIIDLIIASLMLVVITSGIEGYLEIITRFAPNFSLGILSLMLASYWIGKKMHKLICQKKRNAILVGIIGMILILLLGLIGGSTVGFIEYGLLDINDSISEMIIDYYFKPIALISVFGSIPTVLSGAIAGELIARITCYNNV